jgi:hypothetical protein
LDLGRGEPLDDLHRPAALGAGPEGGSGLGVCCAGSTIRYSRGQRAEAKRQQGGALPGGPETEVPDAHEALGKQV